MISWYGLLVLFPVTCALIGWFTNVIAVKMLFRPLEPRRVLGLTFQGVLPKHQARFAREMGEVVTTDLITTGEMVERLDLELLHERLRPIIDSTFDAVVGDLRQRLPESRKALLSDALVEAVRKQIDREIVAELPGVAERIQNRADELVDLADVVASKLLDVGPARLVDLIYRVARRELKFIEYYGAVFGFLIGLFQLGVVTVFPIRYSLPVVGLIVGTVTNYLAIQMLHYPRRPRRFLFLTFQGLFPRRQEEIAREFAEIAADDFVVTGEVFALLSERGLPTGTDRSVVERFEPVFAARFPGIKAMLEVALSPEQLSDFRDQLAVRYSQAMPRMVDALVASAADQLDLRTILTGKVAGLSKLRFEQMIRGLFKQEELYLVFYGGMLGLVMGAVQLGLLLGTGSNLLSR